MIRFDISEWEEKLQSLTLEKIDYIYKNALQQGTAPEHELIKSETKNTISKNGKFLVWDGFRKEIGWGTKFNGEAYEAKIWMNPQGALKWFETGTQPRFKKNGASTGSITGKFIFNDAIDAAMQNDLNKTLVIVDKRLEEEFNK